MLDLDTAIICNVPKKSIHCLKVCFHGIPHEKSNERKESCFLHEQFCNLGGSGIKKVRCRELTAKEKKFYQEQKGKK